MGIIRKAIDEKRDVRIHTVSTPLDGKRIADLAEAAYEAKYGERTWRESVIGKQAKYPQYKISPGRWKWLSDHPNDVTWFVSVFPDGQTEIEGYMINRRITELAQPFRGDIWSVTFESKPGEKKPVNDWKEKFRLGGTL